MDKPELTPERLQEIRDFHTSLPLKRRNTDDRQLLDTCHGMMSDLLGQMPEPTEDAKLLTAEERARLTPEERDKLAADRKAWDAAHAGDPKSA